MAQLSPAQKIYTGVLLGAVAAWLLLKLGIPVYEYRHGKDALAVLLEQIATVFGFAVIGIGLVYTILQRIGVLPAVAAPAQPQASSGVRRLRNLALWIVIALLLVLLFNLFQSGKAPVLDNHATNMILEYLPLVLIAGIWVIFMLRVNARKKKDLGG